MTIQLEPDCWAPGMWAGCEGAEINMLGDVWVITRVDLDARTITLKPKD